MQKRAFDSLDDSTEGGENDIGNHEIVINDSSAFRCLYEPKVIKKE